MRGLWRRPCEGARNAGIGAAFARHSNHFGPVMPYLFQATEQGFAAIIASNATTTIAPSGGREARVGNNPLGIGVPAPGGDPVLLDMAMSVVARAKIRQAAKAGESIPATWATDREGAPTTDPAAALDGFLLPIGGYKGYGLSLMVDLFAGLLSGAAYLDHVSSWSVDPERPQDLGHVFILIDTARLMGSGDLAGPDVGLRRHPPRHAARPTRPRRCGSPGRPSSRPTAGSSATASRCCARTWPRCASWRRDRRDGARAAVRRVRLPHPRLRAFRPLPAGR